MTSPQAGDTAETTPSPEGVSRVRAVVREAVFGSADGANAGIAVVFGQRHLLLAFAILISLTGCLSMAQGEFVGAMAEEGRNFAQEAPGVAAMGLFTFAGTFLPTLPVLVWHNTPAKVLAVVVGTLISVAIGTTIRHVRHPYLISVGSFAAVLSITVGVAAGLGIN